MVSAAALGGFAIVAIGIVMTPGPNMAYVVSRSLSQGRAAGLLSLAGIAHGLLAYMLLAAFGITGIVLGLPAVFEILKFAGALYLAYLAWQTIRPGGRSPFEVQQLPSDSPRRLFVMGMMTALLNPKVAMLYVALLPQFVDPERGNIMLQTITLGLLQITIAVCGNGLFALSASAIARFLRTRPRWAIMQRAVMSGVLCLFAVKMAFETMH